MSSESSVDEDRLEIMNGIMKNLSEEAPSIQCNLMKGRTTPSSSSSGSSGSSPIFLEVYPLDYLSNCQFPFFLPEIRAIAGFTEKDNATSSMDIAILNSDQVMIDSTEVPINLQELSEIATLILDFLDLNKYSFCHGIDENKLFTSIPDLSISDFHMIFIEKSGLVRSRNCLYRCVDNAKNVDEDVVGLPSLCINCSNLFANVFEIPGIDPSSSSSFMCPICEKNCLNSSEIRSHVKSHIYSLDQHETDEPITIIKEEGSPYVRDDYDDSDNDEDDYLPSEKKTRESRKPKMKRRTYHDEDYEPEIISEPKNKLDPSSVCVPKERKKRSWEGRKEIGFNICPVCKEEFTNNARMVIHCKKSHDPKGMECHYQGCRVKLKWQSYYPHVRLVHSGESRRSYMCETCGASYKTKTDMTRHMARHGPDKPYKCKHCSKSFYSMEGWRRCERICSGEGDRYMCEKCSKTFFTKSKLSNHMRIHLGIKPFICPLCNYSTYSRNNLKQHTTKVHKLSIEECEHKTGLSHIGRVPLNQ